MEDVKLLKMEERHDEVIDLLEWCIDCAEAGAKADETLFETPAPEYYRHLGIVLRKEGRYEDEVEVLERYMSWFENTEAVPNAGLVERLERARELAEGR